MSVILEGPDRAGKSTLATVIAGHHKSQVKHLGGSRRMTDGTLVRHWDLVAAEMDHGARNTVYDRMVIGSLVYAFKRDAHNIQPVTPGEYSEWLEWMEDQRNLLICCLPPVATVLERMAVGEDYITQDDMIQVYRRYQTLFKNFDEAPFPVLFYDSSKVSVLTWFSIYHDQIMRALT